MNSNWKLVPVEPTETMVINGFESVPNECFTDDEVWEQYQEMSGCQQAAFRAKLCWAAMIGSAPSAPTTGHIEVVAVINEEGTIFKETVVEHRPGIELLPVGTELVDIAHVIRLTAERDALQQRLNAADQRNDELTQRKAEPVEWGAPKTVRQLIRQLETLDQDLRPLSMLRVPGKVFEDGKDRTRAVHLSFSHERVEGQWLAPFKGDGEKVVAFWCRTEQPAPAAIQICKLGNYGKAYDRPEEKRAYTYAAQPGNLEAHRLGSAVALSAKSPGGDLIDQGLSLLRALSVEGFGVFEITPALESQQQ